MACIEEYTDRIIINERVRIARDLFVVIDELFLIDFSSYLHAIVEDTNIDDCFFNEESYCATHKEEAEWWEISIFEALAALTVEERASVLAMYYGYCDIEGNVRNYENPGTESNPEHDGSGLGSNLILGRGR